MRTIATGSTSAIRTLEKQYHWLQTKLPGKELHFGAHSSDENIWIVSASSDTEPGETYVWNRSANTLALQYRIREELPRTSLSERKPYHFKSSDGLDIPAYLTLPKGLEAKNLPLIVFPHGGPWGVILTASTPSPSSSPTADTLSCSRTSAAPLASARSS